MVTFGLPVVVEAGGLRRGAKGTEIEELSLTDGNREGSEGYPPPNLPEILEKHKFARERPGAVLWGAGGRAPNEKCAPQCPLPPILVQPP